MKKQEKETTKSNSLLSKLNRPEVKRMVKLGGGGLGITVVAAAMFPLLGAIMIFSLGVGALVVMGSLVHGYNVLRKNGVVKPMQVIFENVPGMTKMTEESEQAVNDDDQSMNDDEQSICREFRLYDLNGAVQVFVKEPSMAQVTSTRNSGEESDDLFVVQNNTRVGLFEDNGNFIVRIRILSGDEQGRTGWVCRTAMLEESVKVA